MIRHILCSIIVVAAAVIYFHSAFAKSAPRAVKQASFTYSKEAKEYTKNIQRKDLVNDDQFIKTFQEILSSSLNESAKVDAFMILLDKIGWLFDGSVRIFPGRSYYETYGGIASTYIQYQQALEHFEYNAWPLKETDAPVPRQTDPPHAHQSAKCPA